MAGILNKKHRIFDTILTIEGRKQLAQGTLKAEFVSFTDGNIIYALDTIVSGDSDITDRIQFEATSLPQDTIAIEADDSGRLTGFPVSGSQRFAIRAGQILSASSENETRPVTGSQFASLSNVLLGSSIDNFKKLYILRSPDPVDARDKHFVVQPKTKQFIITQDRPYPEGSLSTARVDHVESFFQDKRLSHLPNYKFLPPVNKARLGENTRRPLGEYINLNQRPILSFEDVKTEISGFEQQGFGETFSFVDRSKENNIVGQFFELSNNEMIKLDVIDFGTFVDENRGTKHVFFAGKVYEDETGSHTFVNMFTIVFE